MKDPEMISIELPLRSVEFQSNFVFNEGRVTKSMHFAEISVGCMDEDTDEFAPEPETRISQVIKLEEMPSSVKPLLAKHLRELLEKIEGS